MCIVPKFIIDWFMIMAFIALLVGRSHCLLAFNCTEYKLYSCIQLPKTKVFQMCPPYLPICGISPPLQSKLLVCYLQTFKIIKLVLCCCFSSWGSIKCFIVSFLFIWLHILTSMHNVTVPNISKRSGKRVPSHKR